MRLFSADRCTKITQAALALITLADEELMASLGRMVPMPARRCGEDDDSRADHPKRRFAIDGEGWAVRKDRRDPADPPWFSKARGSRDGFIGILRDS